MKLIRINMRKETIQYEDLSPDFELFAGRSFIASILNKEVPPKCDPLGRENKLILAVGLLNGTPLINTSRLSIGGKSPLTQTIKESNVGGTIGTALGKLNIRAIIIEDKPKDSKKSYFLRIKNNGEAELIKVTNFRGVYTYKLCSEIFKKYGPQNSILCIGPSGEKLLPIASIQSTDVEGYPCRAAGRGGLGAVMGSKGLKAIIVEHRNDSLKNSVYNPTLFKEAAKKIVNIVKENPFCSVILKKLGTAGLIAPVNSMGAFPSYNARKGIFDDWKEISGEKLVSIIKSRGGKVTHRGCSKCIISCSNQYVNEKGEYITGALEYETIWALGAMIGISDLDLIAEFDRKCDELGIDTMSLGVAIAVAMDSGMAKFGDSKFVFHVFKELEKETSFGKLIGSGPKTVGEYLNHSRVPVVKGQSIAAYDPRAMQGNAVTYATSPMGADHTAGNVIGEYTSGRLDPLSPKGQVEASRNIQINVAAIDCIGLCLFAALPLFETEDGIDALVKVLEAKTGKKLGKEEFYKMGKTTLKLELNFNRNAGFTKKDDRLPKFFYEEPLPPKNTVVTISDEEMDRVFKDIIEEFNNT